MSEASLAPRNPGGPAPPRRAGSIRRTSTIDTSWPEGQGQPMLMRGQARDLVTPADGSAPRVVGEGRFEILATPRREILSIETSPAHPALQALVGQRAGGNLRAALAKEIPQEKAAGSPLYLILDDFSGASLVAGWAWSRWRDDWLDRAKRSGLVSTAGRAGQMEGICTGFAPGSSALNPDGTSNSAIQSAAEVVCLVRPDDPLGWHALAPQEGVGMRRARWIDLWPEGEQLIIEAGFQDSATSPRPTATPGGRIAVHEYRLRAVADRATGELLSLKPDPRVLPYRECPGAVAHVDRLLGGSLEQMRERVLELLLGILGCTHLNDVLRSLAETPRMLEALEG